MEAENRTDMVKDKLSEKVSEKRKKFIQEGIVETRNSTTVKYTWMLCNFSELNHEPKYSDTFFTEDYPWRILLYPYGNGMEKNDLSVFLVCGDSSFLPTGSWSKTAKFKFSLKSYYSGKEKILDGGAYEFSSEKHEGCGFSPFITLTELHDPNNGFLVNDTCTIVAQVCIENDVHHIIPLVTRNNDLVDFKGLCKVRKDFVQLLEEACSKHPELVRGVKRRNWSENFTERFFMALGRVLHFLKSHKDVKDMDDDTYEELQDLWEQLNSFGFDDLTWLKNDVKKYKVKKMKKNAHISCSCFLQL